MYCSECKLRVADDSVTVCPVCQGSLQPDAENEETLHDDTVDKNGSADPEIRVEDKFKAYEKPDQGLDFDPEKLGLQSSEPAAPVEEEDIKVLADLWEEEDIDADLEGVLAEAFSLDEVNEEIEAADELDLGEGDLDLGKPEALPPRPPAAAPSRNSRPLLLLLLLIVIGAGGASWFYSQTTGPKPDQVVKQLPLSQPKESVAAKKIATVEPATVAVENAAVDKTGKLAAATPPQDSASVEVASLKAQEAEVLPKKETANQITVVDSQISAEDQEKSVGQQAEVLAKAATSEDLKAVPSPVSAVQPEKRSGTLVASLDSAGEKASVSAEVLSEGDVKAVDKPKSLVSSSDSLPDEGVGKKSIEVDEKAATDKTEVPPMFSYAIHIGSFKSQKRVSRQLAMLQEKGFAAYQVEVDLKEKGVWQRVMIPGGATRGDAKVVQGKLAELFPREDSLIKKIKK